MTNDEALQKFTFVFFSPGAVSEAVYECNFCFAVVMAKKVADHLDYAHSRYTRRA